MYKKGRVNSNSRIISTDEDPSLRIESCAIINLRGVSTKLNKYIVFTMQTYKKLITEFYGEYTHSSFKRLDRLTNQRSRLINNLTCEVDERIAILTEDLWMTLNEEHYSTAKRMISASSTRTFNKARSTQIARFTKLTSYGQKNRRKQEEDLTSHPLRRTVINRSARNLTPVEEDVLALGLNFAVVPRVLPKEEIVQRLEPKLFHLKNDVAGNIRVQITEVLRRAKLPRSNLTKNVKDAVRNLRADKSIHILKA